MSSNTQVIREDAHTSTASSFMVPLNHQSMSTVNDDRTIIERVNESNVFSNLSLEDEQEPNNYESPNNASQNRTTSEFGGSVYDNRLSGMHNNRMSGLPQFNELASSAH